MSENRTTTRNCKWCERPLSKDAHARRKYHQKCAEEKNKHARRNYQLKMAVEGICLDCHEQHDNGTYRCKECNRKHQQKYGREQKEKFPCDWCGEDLTPRKNDALFHAHAECKDKLESFLKKMKRKQTRAPDYLDKIRKEVMENL